MRRRDFIAGLGSAAVWPLWALGQPATMPVIGYLGSGTRDPLRSALAAFHRGLKENGFVERQNVTIEYRWAEGQYTRLPEMAADLVRRQVAAIAAMGGVQTAHAAKAATSAIPIVFANGSDPIKFGLAASLNRPGGNLTGVSFLTDGMEAKRLGLLRELVPQADVLAGLVNPNFPNSESQSRELNEAARTLGVKMHIASVGQDADFDVVFAALRQVRAGGLVVAADPFFNSRRELISALAARYAIPAIYEWREFAEAGGLASYGTRLADAYHQAGVYTGRVLKGESPADLPVMQSTRFEFVINLKAAKALGLVVSPTMSARADDVIE